MDPDDGTPQLMHYIRTMIGTGTLLTTANSNVCSVYIVTSVYIVGVFYAR